MTSNTYRVRLTLDEAELVETLLVRFVRSKQKKLKNLKPLYEGQPRSEILEVEQKHMRSIEFASDLLHKLNFEVFNNQHEGDHQ